MSAAPLPKEILVRLPTDIISGAALAHAQEHLHPSILAHSIRVFLYARSLGVRESSAWVHADRLALLFTACILHDIGTAEIHNGSQRFEIEAADFSTALLTSRGVSAADAHEVWVAIACHTSPGIADRISTLARLVRTGVKTDFKNAEALKLVEEGEIEDYETLLPRQRIENVLADAVVDQCKRDPSNKAPKVSWPWSLYSSWMEDPEWTGVNRGF